MSELDCLSDETWAVLEPHLPKNRPGTPSGRPSGDQRHPACVVIRVPVEGLPPPSMITESALLFGRG